MNTSKQTPKSESKSVVHVDRVEEFDTWGPARSPRTMVKSVKLHGGPYDGQTVVTDQQFKIGFTVFTKCSDTCGKPKAVVHNYFVNGSEAFYEFPEVV